jgi:ABC-type lipoprotein export system ATPase subunit
VFQAPYLIPFLDVTDNVALLPMLAGRPNNEARERALELLEAVDVGHRAKAQPSELSGGEQQRVSIARALVNRPPVILADEPTAPLDSERAMAVVRILNQMATQYHTATRFGRSLARLTCHEAVVAQRGSHRSFLATRTRRATCPFAGRGHRLKPCPASSSVRPSRM